MQLPSVFAYLDFRVFLKDWLEARKRADPEYSYSTFARTGGCSKAALANVVGGSRSPREGTLDAFARAMELSPPERNYLGLLVELAGAPDVSQRREAMDKILASDRYRQVRQAEHDEGADVYRYLEHWYIPAIREMAGLAGFRDDPVWIASKLRPKIQPEQAAAALDTLFDLGFLSRNDEGEVIQQTIRFRTEPHARLAAAVHYHTVAIPMLIGKLEGTSATERHLLALTCALDPSMVAEVKARLNAMLAQLATLADTSVAEDRQVYQLGIQLLPLTTK